MERRAFLHLLFIGTGTLSVSTSAKALDLIGQLPALGSDARFAPEPSVATAEDIEGAQVDKVWYGHYRRVNRRVSRRVYRRHYY